MVSENRATPSRAELRCGYVWSIVSDSTLSDSRTDVVSQPDADFVTSKKAS